MMKGPYSFQAIIIVLLKLKYKSLLGIDLVDVIKSNF